MALKECTKKEQANSYELEVNVDGETFGNAVNRVYKKQVKSINIPGFRKGKAPRHVIEKMYGSEVFYEDAMQDCYPDALYEAAKEAGIKIVSVETLEAIEASKEGFSFKANVVVEPEMEINNYLGIEVTKKSTEVTDELVDEEIEKVRDRNSRMVTVDDRAAQNDDVAVIDFEGFVDGEAFEGGKAENYNLKLGSGNFIPGFEEQVAGMSAGEEKDINITFPENYHEELAGKAVVFHVKVNKVTETIVPAMDDEFAKDVSEFDTLEALKADIRAKALERAEKTAQTNFETACVDKAAENTTVDLPNALVERELDTQMERFAYQLQMGGYSMEQYAKMMGGDVSTMRNAFRPSAEKQAKVSVTLEKIAEVENVAVTDEEIADEIASLAKQYELEVEKVKKMVPTEELTESLKTRKAVQIIVDSAVAVAPKAQEKAEE